MEKDFFFNNSRKVIINSRDNGMMSKSLTFYLLNHHQGVIILVCVCVCDMYLYIFVIQLYYGYKLVTFNITNFDFSIY